MKYKYYEDKAMKYSKDKADDQESIDIITQSYIAGFLKAREMATELTKKPAWITIRDIPKLGENEV